MKISLGLPLILLFSALVLPACVHLHPDFMAHAADGDSGFRHHDFEDDDDDDDRDGLEQHIRDLEETLQRLEQELGRVHRELEEAHQEMDRRNERDGDDREEHRRDDDRRDDGRRDDDRRDDDRRDDDRRDNDRRNDDRRDDDRRDNPRRMPDRDRPRGIRVERFESNSELPPGGYVFGRTGVRGFQGGMPGNRGPEGRRVNQRDRRGPEGGGWGTEDRNRRNDRGRPRGRQMRPQQRPGADPQARNERDQQQIHWSGSLEEMPDHILEMLKNLDVDIPFGRAGAGDSQVEIEVIRSEHFDGPEGDKTSKRRYVEVDTGKTFEFNLGKAGEGASRVAGESVEWIGDHSMPGEVHIIRVGSDLPSDWKKVSNKKAINKKASNKKAINKKKAAARKKAAMKKKAGNKKAGKQKIDKQETDKKKTNNKKKAAAKKKAGNKKSDNKKSDKKKSDKKKAVEVQSEASFKFVVGGLDGIESEVIFGSTEGIDPDQRSVHYESLEEMPDHIREIFESLEMIPLEEVLGDLDEAPDKKKTDKKKTDKKKSDKKKDKKEIDKKKDDVTLEGRIVL